MAPGADSIDIPAHCEKEALDVSRDNPREPGLGTHSQSRERRGCDPKVTSATRSLDCQVRCR